MVKKKAIFFDRDGVLNFPIIKKRKPFAPLSIKEFKLYKNLKNYEKEIRQNGFVIFVITNQPDYKKKKISLKILKKLNKILYDKFKYDKIYISLSANNKNYYRKPNPGMIMKAKKEFNIDLKSSFVVGDRYSDICLAKKLGMKGVFIDRNYEEKKPDSQICTVKNIKDAVKFILNYKLK